MRGGEAADATVWDYLRQLRGASPVDEDDARWLEMATKLMLEWQPGDGWEPICAALGLPVPDEPFPHRNRTEEFVARQTARAEAKRAATDT